MKLKTNIFFFLLIYFFQISLLQAQVQIGTDIDDNPNAHSGYSISFSADGNRVAIGSPLNFGSGLSSGHVRIFDLSNGDWIQVGATIEGEVEINHAGYSVSLSADGNRIAIGSPESIQNVQGSAQVEVYDWINGSWTQVGQDIEEEGIDEAFGHSISLSADGSRVAIGAPEKDINGISNVGQVRVYDLVDNIWTQTGPDIDGSGESSEMGANISISADGNRLAIVAPRTDDIDNGGYLKVYDWNGNTWSQAGSTISGAQFSADFVYGSMSLSADGNTLAYGSPFESGFSGDVKIFGWTNNNWSQIGEDIVGQNDAFGSSIALSGDGSRIAIGAQETNGNGNDAGSLRLYERNGNNWIQVEQDINGEAPGDQCGLAVALSLDGNIAAVSSRLNDGGGQDSGHTRIYGFACSTVTTTDEIAACNTYTWIDGITYSASNNTATFTSTTTQGCDSIINLNLTINNVDVSVTDNSPGLMANASNATYQWLDCDNGFAILLEETNQEFTAVNNGNYAVMVSQNNCVDTSECFLVTNVSVIDSDFESALSIFPNPTDQVVQIDLGKVHQKVQVVLRNTLGNVVHLADYDSVNKFEVEITNPGIYFLEIIVEEKSSGVFQIVRY